MYEKHLGESRVYVGLGWERLRSGGSRRALPEGRAPGVGFPRHLRWGNAIKILALASYESNAICGNWMSGSRTRTVCYNVKATPEVFTSALSSDSLRCGSGPMCRGRGRCQWRVRSWDM